MPDLSLREKLTAYLGSTREADRVLKIVRDHDDSDGRAVFTRKRLAAAIGQVREKHAVPLARYAVTADELAGELLGVMSGGTMRELLDRAAMPGQVSGG